MKQLFYLTALLCLASFTFSQPAASQSSFAGIHYQTVIRDSEGLPLQNAPVTLLMTIRTNTPDGQAAYSETHSATTNLFGLVNLVIGQGTPVSGTFDAINWSAAPHYLETAIDAIGSGEFQVLGVTQFLSVPYALSSSNGVPGGNNPGDMLYWNGDTWIQVPAGQNGQVLTFSNGVPVWGGVQLPILNTSAVTNITAFTAYSGGTIASDGGSPIVGRGICWNNSPNPTTGNFKVFAGSGSGNFLAQMTGLESSTQYFVRAFATNSAGTSYGQEMTFYTTAGNITLSTTAVTNIATTTATSGGNITLNGGSPVTARGVCWNTSAYPTTAHNKTTDGSGNGNFVSQLTGMTNNTTYYVRAYATNSLGTSYGNQLTFTTLSGIITLTTAGVTGITNNSATCGGEITSDGGSPVTARGVCWNTLPNPTTANSLTTDGTGTGAFVSTLTGLTENTTYYVRAYATNAVGTYYGNEVSFATPVWECGFPITDSRDGKTYNTVHIGEQCWTAENLNLGTRIESGINQLNNGIIEKYCYNNLESNCDLYGGLYQWDEMMEYSTNQNNKGICPIGWHLPSQIEFTSMISFLGGEEIAGGNMKETGTTYWQPPNTGANNSSGFSGLGSGFCQTNGQFVSLKAYANFWTSIQNGSDQAYSPYLYFLSANVTHSSFFKNIGFSVRCLKDNEPLVPFNPSPETGSTNNSINPILTWSCFNPESIPIDFDVFFGTENPPAQVATAIADTFYTPGTLNYNTTYYWKIVAHDDHGNSTEGEVWSFTTFEDIGCPQSFIDSRDGKNYSMVQIGNQCWMAENLNIGIKIDGSQNQQNNGVIEKYCYSNLESNCDVYGGLYQWNEAMSYSTSQGIMGICPNGYHLPTDDEWNTLSASLGGEDVAGGKMKETGTLHWNSPNIGATNISGFTAIPGGSKTNSFNYLGKNARFRSSSQYDENNSWGVFLSYDNTENHRSFFGNVYGFSVRCIKN